MSEGLGGAGSGDVRDRSSLATGNVDCAWKDLRSAAGTEGACTKGLGSSAQIFVDEISWRSGLFGHQIRSWSYGLDFDFRRDGR